MIKYIKLYIIINDLRYFGLRLAVLSLGTLISNSSGARTAFVVAPSAQANVEGNAAGGIFSTSPPPSRSQQVYAASEFASLSSPLLISQITFRPDAFFQGPTTTSFTGIQIDLSTTSRSPNALSATFADNVGADDTIVYSGSLTLSTAATGPASGPKDFDVVIDLQKDFLYNPAAGNLLMDITKPAQFTGGSIVLDQQFTVGGSVSSVVGFQTDVNAPIPTVGTPNTGGLVTRFTATPVVPEPLSVVLLGLGLMGASGLAWRARLRRDDSRSD